MSKTKIVLLLTTLLCAQWSAAGTLEELVDAQRESLRAEAQRKTEASKPLPVAQASPVQSVARSEKAIANKRASDLDDAKLIAVYGPLYALTAEIMFNGVVFPVKKGGETVEGWRVESINQSRVVLNKVSANGKTVRTQIMYLSDAAVNPALATGPIPSAMGMSMPLPSGSLAPFMPAPYTPTNLVMPPPVQSPMPQLPPAMYPR